MLDQSNEQGAHAQAQQRRRRALGPSGVAIGDRDQRAAAGFSSAWGGEASTSGAGAPGWAARALSSGAGRFAVVSGGSLTGEGGCDADKGLGLRRRHLSHGLQDGGLRGCEFLRLFRTDADRKPPNLAAQHIGGAHEILHPQVFDLAGLPRAAGLFADPERATQLCRAHACDSESALNPVWQQATHRSIVTHVKTIMFAAGLAKSVNHVYLCGMTKTAAIRHFGSQTALARQLGLTKQAVSMWPERVPLLRQYQLERITAGALRVDDDLPSPAAEIAGDAA